jgi:hypothetical protein
MLSTWDIIEEHFGFMLVWGDMVKFCLKLSKLIIKIINRSTSYFGILIWDGIWQINRQIKS